MLTVAPATSSPTATSTGHGFAGQHRLVDRRLALDDDAVGGDLLAGPDDEQVADLQLVDRDEDLLPVAQHARLLGPELEQLADRLDAAALGARLEVAAEQDQRRHDRRHLEVGVRVDDRPTSTTVDQRQAASVPSEISVSIVAAPWRAFISAARWKPIPE